MSILAIKQLKEQPETAAKGTKWTQEEEAQLVNSLRDGKNINDIAKEHKRTPGGILSRRRQLAVRMIESEGKSIEEVCMSLHMRPEDIEQPRQTAANNKTTASELKPETELEILNDIREILIRIESKLFKE